MLYVNILHDKNPKKLKKNFTPEGYLDPKLSIWSVQMLAHIDMRRQLFDLTRGFFCYRQRKACSLDLIESYDVVRDAIDKHYSSSTYFIVILNLRVLLIVNEWYAEHEHRYFRNIPTYQFKQRKNPTAHVKIAKNMDPRSVFILSDQKTTPELVATRGSTFFSYMQ